jgi:hypothetical protein
MSLNPPLEPVQPDARRAQLLEKMLQWFSRQESRGPGQPFRHVKVRDVGPSEVELDGVFNLNELADHLTNE